MNQTENHKNMVKNDVKFNFDILDQLEKNEFDDLDFKPLNKGLGFHNEQKRVSPLHNSIVAKSPIRPKKQNLDRSHDSLSNFYQKAKEPTLEISTETISPFYEEKKKNNCKKLEVKPRIIEAQLHICFFAWLVDVCVISIGFSLTSLGFVIFSGIDFFVLKTLVTPIELLLFGSFIYGVFYIMYFTLLDLVSTPGNALFGVKLLRVDNTEVWAFHTFLRAIFTLMVVLTGFVTYFLNFQNKLSDTKIVQS